MELEDFKKQLMIEPGSQDEAVLAARRSSVQHMAAAKKSDAFESALEAALRFDTDNNLATEILAGVWQQGPAAGPSPWGRWAAAAASVTLALGIGAFIYNGTVEATPMREAFVAHMNNRYEYPMALTRADVQPESEVRETFNEFGADLDGGFGEVTYLARCKIGKKLGVHLVVTEDSGDKTTVMFLPGEELLTEISFDVDQVTARMVPTPTGVAALFGHDGQDLSATTAALLQGLGGFGLASLAAL